MADDASTNTVYDQYGDISKFQWNLGDASSPMLLAPGSINPFNANPYVGGNINDMMNLRNQFSQSVTNDYMNPGFYNMMRDQSGDRLTAGINNQYARMGLTGSSANAGAVTQGLITNDNAWRQNQLNDQIRAMQGQSLLDNNINNMMMGVQNQYGGWQNSIIQTIMGMKNAQNQQQASENQMWGQIISGGLSGGGTAAAGLLMA